MATKSAKKPEVENASSKVTKVETRKVNLDEIVSNSSQSRGTGVIPNLEELGYGLFEAKKGSEDKVPIWTMLDSTPEDKQFAVNLVKENEPSIYEFANKLATTGQLQPIGLHPVDGGMYDVIFGMRRALALRVANAIHNTKKEVEAKIYFGELTSIDKLFFAIEENEDREQHNPIDLALTFQRLQKLPPKERLTPLQIGERIGKSDQYIRQYVKLLDPLLEDKRADIAQRKLGVEPAMRLLDKRKEDAGAKPSRSTKKDARARWLSVQAMEKMYDKPKQPKSMSNEEFDLWISDDVRKLMAIRLNMEYVPYEGRGRVLPEKGEDDSHATNGETPKEDTIPERGKPSGKILKVKRDTAVELLSALGQTDCENWKNEDIQENLESIVNLVDPEQGEMPSKTLQNLLEKLVEGYTSGLKIRLVTE